MKRKIMIFSIRDNKVLSVVLYTLLLLFLSVGVFHQNSSGGIWTGWYPLMIPEPADGVFPVSELLDISGGKLVYHGNARYFYNSFSTIRSASLDQQEEGKGLLSPDPRLDPFILGAGKYYKQGIYSIFYLPADRSPLQYRRALRQLWDSSWILPDIRWNFPVLILAGLLSFFLLIRSGGGFLPCLLIITYTGALIFRGNQNILIPGVISVFLMSHYRKTGPFSLVVMLLVPMAGIAAFITDLISIMDCIVFLLTFLAGILIPVSSPRLFKGFSDRTLRDHELFVPLSLGSAVIREGRSIKKIGYLLIQSVFLLVFLFTAATQNRQLPTAIPGYGEEEGSIWSWEGISLFKPSAEIPGVREMLMHKAYQESYPYGGTWRLPVEGEILSMPVYTMSEGRIQSSLKVIQLYNQEWLDGFLKEMPLEGPGALLKGETGPRSVIMRIEKPGAASTTGFMVLVFIGILGILLNLLNAAVPYGSPSVEYRMRYHLLILRRKQQAA